MSGAFAPIFRWRGVEPQSSSPVRPRPGAQGCPRERIIRPYIGSWSQCSAKLEMGFINGLWACSNAKVEISNIDRYDVMESSMKLDINTAQFGVQ